MKKFTTFHLVLLIAAFFISSLLNGQITLEKIYYPPYVLYGGWGSGIALEQTPDNGFAILTRGGWPMGWSDANCFIKTDENGDTLFTKVNMYSYCWDLSDFCLTSDGGFMMVGGTAIWGGSFEMVKLNGQGDTVWTKHGGLNDVAGSSIIQTNDENYIISYGWGNCRIAKINEYGDSLWTRRYEEAEPCVIQQVIETDDEGLVMVGYYDNNSFDDQSSIIKCNTDGNQEWIQTYDNLWLFSICQADNGDYLALGSDGENSGEDCVIRMDGIGNLLWMEHPLGLIINTYEKGAICNAGNDNYAIACSTTGSDENGYLAKIDGEGTLLWSESYGSILRDVKLTNDNGLVATGRLSPPGLPYLVKTTQDGIVTSVPGHNASTDQGFTLFPNPTTGVININYDFKVHGDATITIRNMNGKIIRCIPVGNVNGISCELNGREFSPGIYVVALETDKRILTEKLIIE